MSNFIGKIPFFRLLVSVLISILFFSIFPEVEPHWSVAVAGIALMLFSFLIPKSKQFDLRWVFGLGTAISIFYLTGVSYKNHEHKTEFTFPETESDYLGVITDIPEVKPRSIAINVKITHPLRKKIVLYLEQTDEARALQPGDEIAFSASIQPFKNFGNPDDFDYKKFMKTKGFTGSSYIPQNKWQVTGREQLTIYTVAQRFRAKALEFYRSFQLSPDAYAFISALTLGYKADLTDDIQEAFRASGTSHILAVSGLHVGIIYALINILFSFLGNSGKRYIIRQLLIIAILWAYVFITGMSISVIRAAIMLSLFCIGNATMRSGFTYNTLAAAAFLILIFRPFSFFEVGFQMSFGAVLSILYFQPKLKSLFSFKNKIANYIYDLFTVSVAAQIGVFPLVLYYFGTFPTYFFITNMLVVPMVGIIVYSLFPVILFALLLPLQSTVIGYLYAAFQWILKTLIEILLRIVYIAETLPFAQISDKYISLIQVVFLFILIVSVTRFLISKRAQPLIVSLASITALLLINLHSILYQPSPRLVIFNKSGMSEIGMFVKNKREYVELQENGFIPHSSKTILRLSNDLFLNVEAESKFPVDILILSENRNFSIKNLSRFLQPGIVVIDSSLPKYTATRIYNECNNLGIPSHDVSQNGAYSVDF